MNVTRVKQLSDLTQEEVDELFRLSNTEYEEALRRPLSDLCCPGWLSEEFVDALVMTLMELYGLRWPLDGFRAFLQFVSQVGVECPQGLVLLGPGAEHSVTDYVEDGQIIVGTQGDQSGFLNGQVYAEYFQLNNLHRKAIIALGALAQYAGSRKRVDPCSLFKPSVAQISVVLPFRQGL